MDSSSVNAIDLLSAWTDGDQHALDRLMPMVYDELRRIAQRYLRQERDDHTLQTTALVHEAYLRLAGQREVKWEDRAQLLGLAAQMMRRILVNHAVARRTSKRSGWADRIALDDATEISVQKDVDVMALDHALTTLAELDARQSRIVELRYFGGLTVEETAAVVGVSAATVKRDWTTAKLWLYREIANHA